MVQHMAAQLLFPTRTVYLQKYRQKKAPRAEYLVTQIEYSVWYNFVQGAGKCVHRDFRYVGLMGGLKKCGKQLNAITSWLNSVYCIRKRLRPFLYQRTRMILYEFNPYKANRQNGPISRLYLQ